ncbi:hypothetical protein H696_03678 [Fonticula alba]|uniref:Cytochrome c oxidase subunit VIIc n=1 Tax=Fonticula alba TaxID=691883 RepID=A0A058Z6T5_FONAL|nr:hypothetical protein H696_03678 [Fonticula alba]KCV69252.1 hypothetical protein H696_03678 [Fonticula alba]|eukprot:XP_009495817.1 hypothetical protein H696_03678 [Fonticula alba]
MSLFAATRQVVARRPVTAGPMVARRFMAHGPTTPQSAVPFCYANKSAWRMKFLAFMALGWGIPVYTVYKANSGD